MDRHLVAAALLMASTSAAAAQSSWLTMGEAAYQQIKQAGHRVTIRANRLARLDSPSPAENLYMVEVNSRELQRITGTLHRKLRHCGGYMYHSSEAEARKVLEATRPVLAVTRPSYAIVNQDKVAPLLAQMDAGRIEQTIRQLSNFVNRYYTSAHGAEASNWLRANWEALGKGQPIISVEQVTHAGYGQKSVIATIAGSDKSAQVIVLGAHLDSINLTLKPDTARAPGADDDASGVAVLTEVLRAVVAANYRPRRTIKLIAYAAEEVGLRGSQDIAREFSKNNVDVVGVLQLDMTNFKGSDKDIYLISDYTDTAQNGFLGKLVEAYLPGVQVGADRCGYACSDHASWNALGFAASMPFEAMLSQDNPHIHGRNDTYANSGSQAVQALKFARMAAAYAVELGTDAP